MPFFAAFFIYILHKGVNLFEYADVCKALTVEDAQKRIGELFNESQCAVSAVLPKKE